MSFSIGKSTSYLKRIILEFQPDVISVYAAGVSWYIVLSVFPFSIVLLSIIKRIPIFLNESILARLDFIPIVIRDLLQSVFIEIEENTTTIVVLIGFFTGTISASTGMNAMMCGMNVVYKQAQPRAVWRTRIYCVLYTLLFLALILAVLVLVVFGESLYKLLFDAVSTLPVTIVKLIDFRFWVIVAVLSLFFALLYTMLPNRPTQWYREIPGAVVAACGWMAFSHIYSLYISNIDRLSMVYGSLALIVLGMVWLYSCVLIVFIGAYVNVLLQKIGNRS